MSAAADQPERILIVRPSALGDVARTVPALASLRRAYPESRIDWLVRDTYADAVAAHPALSDVVPFPREVFGRVLRRPAILRSIRRYMADLRRRGYEVVYDLQGLGRSGWLTWATRAPRRVGAADARELAWLGYNRCHRIRGSATHTVDRMLAILAADGVEPVRDMRLYVADSDATWAERCLADHGIPAQQYAVLAPTAAHREKRWPMDRFDQIADRLGDHGFPACIVVGAAAERGRSGPPPGASHASGGPRRVDLVGRTTVGQLMAIIQRCRLLIANDSAAAHLAVGLGRRVVSIFGPTDPGHDGPYRYDVGVVRPPDQLADNDEGALRERAAGGPLGRAGSGRIESVSVEQVATAVGRVLASPPPDPTPQPEPAHAGA